MSQRQLTALPLTLPLTRWVVALHPVGVCLPLFGLGGIVDLRTIRYTMQSICKLYATCTKTPPSSRRPHQALGPFPFSIRKKKRLFPRSLDLQFGKMCPILASELRVGTTPQNLPPSATDFSPEISACTGLCHLLVRPQARAGTWEPQFPHQENRDNTELMSQRGTED